MGDIYLLKRKREHFALFKYKIFWQTGRDTDLMLQTAATAGAKPTSGALIPIQVFCVGSRGSPFMLAMSQIGSESASARIGLHVGFGIAVIMLNPNKVCILYILLCLKSLKEGKVIPMDLISKWH